MVNNINSQIGYDNNIIAAKKLSDKTTGSREKLGLIKLPETSYSYSTDEYSNQMQELRKEARYEQYSYEQASKRAQRFFSIIKSILFVGATYIAVKNIKIPKKWFS